MSGTASLSDDLREWCECEDGEMCTHCAAADEIETYNSLLPRLIEAVEAERQQGRDRKQKAAASHATGNYDRLLGYESALEWCARLLRTVTP